MKEFQRIVLIDGQSISYQTTAGDLIVTNKDKVTIEKCVIESPFDLDDFAKVLSAAFSDHQQLARGLPTVTRPEFQKKKDPFAAKRVQSIRAAKMGEESVLSEDTQFQQGSVRPDLQEEAHQPQGGSIPEESAETSTVQ